MGDKIPLKPLNALNKLKVEEDFEGDDNSDTLNFDSYPSSKRNNTMPDSFNDKSRIGLENSRELSSINKMYDVLYTDKHTIMNLEE